MTLGSLFDGIGGFLLAARHAGVTPVWASEIEPFPCSVTARHFPDVKQLGDITQINLDEIEPVDIICAGSPCQDLSIAGKRKGLCGERSGLFRTAVDLVRRMRDRTGGRYPRFFVWENVPGAFSSNRGMDFQAVLQEIGESKIPMPQGNRWAAAGLVQCPGAEIAWRVLDAQYWGVPQRRKRIFLVADFAADDRCAGEILFEPEGVSGDPATGEGAGEGTARGAADGTRTAGTHGIVSAGFIAGNKNGGIGYKIEQAATIKAQWGGQAPTVAIYDMTHADEVMRPVKDGIVPTLNARMGTGGNQVPVAHIYGTKSYSEYEMCDMWKSAEGKRLLRETFTAVQEIWESVYCKKEWSRRSVRRLTPLEVERLQGLPDGYTDGGSDTARYKALGNGMAQPCATYIIKRIVECAKEVR